MGDPSLYSEPVLPSLEEEQDPPATFEHRHVTVETGLEFSNFYDVHEALGKGRFGTVHRVVEKATNQQFAAKFIRCVKARDREKVREEIEVMNLLDHSKLLQVAGAFEQSREIVMVVEYISGGELFERVAADDFVLTECDVVLFMRQICEAVAFMHKNSVVHLDLKPENIMCLSKNSHRIKLIDFGLARRLDPTVPVRVMFGTPEFVAPEIINYEPISLASDMWSVGVICFVLLSGLSPFMGDNDAETFTNITRAEYDFDDEAFDSVSTLAKDFISILLDKKQEKRLSAEACLNDIWLSQRTLSLNAVQLSTDKLRKFIVRRKWQKSYNTVRALGRMVSLSSSRSNSAGSPQSNEGSPGSQLASTGGHPGGGSIAETDEDTFISSPECTDKTITADVPGKLKPNSETTNESTPESHDKRPPYSNLIYSHSSSLGEEFNDTKKGDGVDSGVDCASDVAENRETKRRAETRGTKISFRNYHYSFEDEDSSGFGDLFPLKNLQKIESNVEHDVHTARICMIGETDVSPQISETEKTHTEGNLDESSKNKSNLEEKRNVSFVNLNLCYNSDFTDKSEEVNTKFIKESDFESKIKELSMKSQPTIDSDSNFRLKECDSKVDVHLYSDINGNLNDSHTKGDSECKIIFPSGTEKFDVHSNTENVCDENVSDSDIYGKTEVCAAELDSCSNALENAEKLDTCANIYEFDRSDKLEMRKLGIDTLELCAENSDFTFNTHRAEIVQICPDNIDKINDSPEIEIRDEESQMKVANQHVTNSKKYDHKLDVVRKVEISESFPVASPVLSHVQLSKEKLIGKMITANVQPEIKSSKSNVANKRTISNGENSVSRIAKEMFGKTENGNLKEKMITPPMDKGKRAHVQTGARVSIPGVSSLPPISPTRIRRLSPTKPSNKSLSSPPKNMKTHDKISLSSTYESRISNASQPKNLSNVMSGLKPVERSWNISRPKSPEKVTTRSESREILPNLSTQSSEKVIASREKSQEITINSRSESHEIVTNSSSKSSDNMTNSSSRGSPKQVEMDRPTSLPKTAAKPFSSSPTLDANIGTSAPNLSAARINVKGNVSRFASNPGTNETEAAANFKKPAIALPRSVATGNVGAKRLAWEKRIND